MDAFERIVASVLDRQGFWTRTEVKVDLTKQEKRDIARALGGNLMSSDTRQPQTRSGWCSASPIWIRSGWPQGT